MADWNGRAREEHDTYHGRRSESSAAHGDAEVLDAGFSLLGQLRAGSNGDSQPALERE